MNDNNGIWFRFSLFVLALFGIYFLLQGLIQFLHAGITLLIAAIFFSVYFIMTYYFKNRITGWRYPNCDELFREDRALLGYIVFIQGTIFLTLEIILLNKAEIKFFKLLIAFVTIFFFTSRSYAYIKNSGIWRLRSIQIFIYLSLSELTVIILPHLNEVLPIFINEYTFTITFCFVSLIIAAFGEILSIYFKSRYEI